MEKINKGILVAIKKKFCEYKTYYEILDLEKNNITDEKVKEAYNKSCKELNGLFKGVQGREYEELREKIQITLDDAYTALKTELSRKNYQDLLDYTEESER